MTPQRTCVVQDSLPPSLAVDQESENRSAYAKGYREGKRPAWGRVNHEALLAAARLNPSAGVEGPCVGPDPEATENGREEHQTRGGSPSSPSSRKPAHVHVAKDTRPG